VKQIALTHSWYPAQSEIFHSLERFIVVCAGRRFGKTRCSLQWIVTEALKNPASLNWIVAPTYRQSKISLRFLLTIYPKHKFSIIKSFHKAENKITLINDSIIEFKSADKPENLEGESLNALVIEEAGITLKDDLLWFQSLRPTVADSLGRVLFIGTPKGTSLFKTFYNYGQDHTYPDWISFNLPSWKGHLGLKKYKGELENLKRTLPAHIYNQEIKAEFIDGGTAFRNIKTICSYRTEPKEGSIQYTAGIDLAKYRDYTVVSIGYGNKCVYIEKLDQLDFSVQLKQMRTIFNKYPVQEILVDRTGLGEAVVEAMQALFVNIHVEPIYFTNEKKTNILNNLIILFEQAEIECPNNKELIDELKNFEFSITPTGKAKMQAGMGHDDMVISLALLFWGLRGQDANPWLEAFGFTEATKYKEIGK